MFLINISYKTPLSAVDAWLSAHVAFLEKYYQQDIFLLSGRKQPRTGGVILAQGIGRVQLEEILQQDPFYEHKIAEYEIIEFSVTKSHRDVGSYLAAGSKPTS